MVATSAVINFDSPGAPAVGLPGLANPAVDAYGGYAAGLWASALAPELANATWTWPDPASAPGVPVPSVVGLDLVNAKALLASKGFRMAELDQGNNLECASSVPLGGIAYAGPSIAPPGSTIVVCPSNGVSCDHEHASAPGRPVAAEAGRRRRAEQPAVHDRRVVGVARTPAIRRRRTESAN